jgi:hypothetical protein
VGSSEEQGVLEVPVDGLRVVPARVEASEVGIAGRDGPDVLGSVEAPGLVLIVRMEPDGDGAATHPLRQPVVVVPALVALGTLMSVQGLTSALMALPLAIASQRIAPGSSLAVGAGLVGVGFSLTPMTDSVPALATTVAIWSTGEALWTLVAQGQAANRAPAGFHGRYQGALGLAWSTGRVLAPLLGSMAYSYSPVVLWLGCGVTALAAGMLVVGRTDRSG